MIATVIVNKFYAAYIVVSFLFLCINGGFFSQPVKVNEFEA